MGEREVHAPRAHQLPGGAVELHGGPGPFAPDHLHLAPDGDASHLERLRKRFLGRETDGEGFRRAGLPAAVRNPAGLEEAVQDPPAPALDAPAIRPTSTMS